MKSLIFFCYSAFVVIAFSVKVEGATIDLMGAIDTPPNAGSWKLNHFYKGVLKQVYVTQNFVDSKAAAEPEEITFTNLVCDNQSSTKGPVLMLRASYPTNDDSQFLGICPVFVDNEPSVELLKNLRDVKEFDQALRPQKGFTDIWGMNRQLHTTAFWSCFSKVDSKTIKVISVFASLSKIDSQWKADGLLIKMGNFVQVK